MMALDPTGILRGMLPPLLILMSPPSLPQVVVPIPSLLAFPFISENATATVASVSFALAFELYPLILAGRLIKDLQLYTSRGGRN